jgi:hypothetical protein
MATKLMRRDAGRVAPGKRGSQVDRWSRVRQELSWRPPHHRCFRKEEHEEWAVREGVVRGTTHERMNKLFLLLALGAKELAATIENYTFE